MKKIIIVLIAIVVVILGYLWLRSFEACCSQRIDIDMSSPQNIVTKIETEVYATSIPIDQDATIRWGEEGTGRNKDVPSFGVYISGYDQDIFQSYYNKTRNMLEQNSFVLNARNSFGDLAKNSREDAGYINGKTICTVSISTNVNKGIYYLDFKCGIFDGIF